MKKLLEMAFPFVAFALVVYAVFSEEPWGVNLAQFFVGLTLAVVLLGCIGGGWKESEEPKGVRQAVMATLDVLLIIVFAAGGWFWCASAWTFTTIVVQIAWPHLRKEQSA